MPLNVQKMDDMTAADKWSQNNLMVADDETKDSFCGIV